MKHEESATQRACVEWFRMQYPKLALNLIAIPNGGSRRRVEAAIMKAEGVTAGAADLALFVPSTDAHALFIEMKSATGRQRDSQKAWQQAVEAQGYAYRICRSADEFVDIIRHYFHT